MWRTRRVGATRRCSLVAASSVFDSLHRRSHTKHISRRTWRELLHLRAPLVPLGLGGFGEFAFDAWPIHEREEESLSYNVDQMKGNKHAT